MYESSLGWGSGQAYDASTMASTTIDLLPNVDSQSPEFDQARRRELRTFLMSARSRLGPSDVGLPHTLRRRVPGLRRGEVAELIGVTFDWYRWFEGGRSIRVSPGFVLRLIVALRLSELEALTLYQLSIPEMYLATRRALAGSAVLGKSLSPSTAAAPLVA
jgi:hypothetical protein